MAIFTLYPTTSYFGSNVDSSWEHISEIPSWDANAFFLARRWLFQMPPVSIDPSKITSIAMDVSIELPSYATQGMHSIDVGFTNSVATPSSVTTCSVNVTDNTTQLKFNVVPTVDISREWYIYLYDAGHAQGKISTVSIEYDAYTHCGAPLTCSLSETLSTVDATLSWSGATAGQDNEVTGYEVQRCESTNGSNWGAWSHLTTTTASSLSVEPPETPGNYYKYRVRTLGAAGSSYYSEWKESTNTLRRDHAPLEGFTDPVLTAGATPIKAIHMQELQDRVATLRTFYGLSAYGFTNIIAGQTSLGNWTMHVNEIRVAIDEIGIQHDTWLVITENKPRADVITQMRNVVLGDHNVPVEPPVVDTTSALDSAVLDTMELAE